MKPTKRNLVKNETDYVYENSDKYVKAAGSPHHRETP
jgi:hypothetical protein